MPLYLSLYTCWLPRKIYFQKSFIRLTSSTSDNRSSSYRSASRFSLKVARFLFLKRDIKSDSATPTILPASTHAHYSKRETDDDIQALARNFLLSLEPGKFSFHSAKSFTNKILLFKIIEEFSVMN